MVELSFAEHLARATLRQPSGNPQVYNSKGSDMIFRVNVPVCCRSITLRIIFKNLHGSRGACSLHTLQDFTYLGPRCIMPSTNDVPIRSILTFDTSTFSNTTK